MIVLAPVHVLVDPASRERFSAVPGYRPCERVPPASDLEPFVCDPRVMPGSVPADRSYPWIVLVRGNDAAQTLDWLERGADEVFVDKDEPDIARHLAPVIRSAAVRRAAQRRTRASERSYRAMVESALDVLTLIDDLGTILYESPSILPMLGHDPAALVGRNALEFVHPGDRARILKLLGEGRSIARFEATAEYRFLHADGTWRSVESRAVNRLGEPGIDAIVVVTRDVHDRRATEQRLRDSEIRFRTLFEQSPEAVFVESHDGRVLDANPQACRLHDADREWLVGRSVLELVPERFVGTVAGEFPRVVDGTLARGEGWSLTRTGKEVPVEFSVGHIEWSGEPALLLHVRDISRRRATESLLRLLGSHQQGRIEAERARMAREVHDVLGQSLTALKFDAARIAQSAERAVASDLEVLTSELDRTLSIVRRIAADLRPGILDDLGLTAAVEWLARRFGERTGLPCVVAGTVEGVPLDPDRSIALFRVVQELLTNVARHADAKTVAIGLSSDADTLRIRVEDDGRGFDHGAPASNAHLGLLGMRERLGPWGGTLAYERVEPSGTRALITLPL